jgi:hypothetical protein
MIAQQLLVLVLLMLLPTRMKTGGFWKGKQTATLT